MNNNGKVYKTSNALPSSEEKYRALIESMDQGFCIIEMIFNDKNQPVDYRFLEVNLVFENQTGLKAATGKTARELVPDLEERWFSIYGNVALTGEPAMFTEGSEAMGRWFRVNAFRVNKENHQVAILFTDTTAQETSERETKKNQDLLQTVFNSAPNGIAVMQNFYNKDGQIDDFTILLFNAYTLNWIGDTDYKGKRYSEVFPMVKETGILEKFKEVAETGVTANFERWYAGEGMKHWFRFNAVKQGGLLVVTTEDITERKRAEESLKENEARFRNIIEQAPVAIGLTRGAEFIFESINEPMLQIINRSSKEEVIGKKIFEVLPELENQPVKNVWLRVLETGEPFEGAEVPVDRIIDGVLKGGYFNLSYNRIVDATGNSFLLHMAVDVTQQVVARRKVQESESRFRSLIEEAPVAMALYTGAELKIEVINDTMVAYMGKGRSIIGKPLAQALPELDGQAFVSIFQNVFDTGQPFQVSSAPAELIVDGLKKQFYFDYTAKALRNGNGEIYGVLNMGVDVTEQVLSKRRIEESESRFRMMADVVPQILWTARADGFVDYYNKVWYEYTGSDDNVPSENSWAPFIHPEDLPEMADVWGNSISKEIPYQFEFRMKEAKTGDYRWFLAKAIPVRDAEGKLIKWFGATGDIHEQKLFAERLENLVSERTKALQRSNEDLQQFAHVASHDLKEPVRKIRTFGTRLTNEFGELLPEKAKSYLARLESATARIYSMIDGVLLYSSLNALEGVGERVDLNETIKDIETDLEISILQKGALIQYESLPVVNGIPILIYQLFYNLINNSIKFSPEEKPQINITSSVRNETGDVLDSTHDYVTIVVQDNGIGFKQSQAEEIFKTFTRLNSKDKFEGTGLGLALCKKIVEQHGGTIKAQSIEGEGANFIFTLPLYK